MEQLVPSPSQCVTEEEYLRLEEASSTRHEFRHGRIIDMAGGTIDHGLIAANCLREIGNKLRGRKCFAFGSDVRVKIRHTSQYCYPDVTVFCGTAIFDPPDRRTTLANPQMIIEVTSPSSLADDRGDKFYDYMSIESLQEYILVSQDRLRVDTFYRQVDGIWAIGPSANGLESKVTFRSLGVDVPLLEIYAGVEFPPPEPVKGE